MCQLPAFLHALGSNASGLAVAAFSAPLADSTLVVPLAMEGAVLKESKTNAFSTELNKLHHNIPLLESKGLADAGEP